MCGITGWADWKRNLAQAQPVVSAMTGTLAPRGPDAEGTWVSEHVALGHRRLAVIDIECGIQPMTRAGRAGQPVAVTFSGEIYNFTELRDDLRSRGWSFATRSDTEVLLTAYLEWGHDAVARLNGMFAFAVWDEQKQQLLLARDRLGIKPLYYAQVDDALVFGSEPKALLAYPGLTAEVGRDGIAELMVVPRARTPGHGVFAGISEVKPGHLILADHAGFRQARYWKLVAAPHEAGPAATAAHVRDLLEDIVGRQVISDVPVGTLLSGGIDSSAITAMAVPAFASELTSFSVSVPTGRPGTDLWRPSPDEPYAKLVAEWLGLKHVVTEVTADDLVDNLDRGLVARDLPGWGDLDTSMYLLFRAARERCTVVLSGESAEEVFGGYAWQLREEYVRHRSFPWMSGKTQPESLLREEIRRELEPERYEADRYGEALAEVPLLPGEDARSRRMREVFYLGLTRWLGALLDRKDRMSMAVGLEVRVPFADHRLAEYLFNVPMAIKAAGGVEKALLRNACHGLLPQEVLRRRKSAYPASRDVSYLHRMRELVADLLAQPAAPVFDLVDPAKVAGALGSDTVPGPITAATPAIGLSYLWQLNRWLELYHVRVVM